MKSIMTLHRGTGKRPVKARNWSNLQVYSLGALPLLLLFVFKYIPMFGLVIAFKDYKFDLGILGSPWVGLRNFTFFFTSNEFTRITVNTLYLNFLFIAFGTIGSIVLALLLFDLKSRRSTKIYQTVLITPHFLSWVVAGYMLYAILNPRYGMLNIVFDKLGFGKPDWYSMPSVWPGILTISSVWKNIGMDSVIYYAALMGMDVSLFEAAKIDGASEFKVKLHIVLPSLISLVTILTILKIGNIFRAEFGLFYQLTRDVGALYPTTDVIDTYIFRTMRVVGNMGMSSAVGLLQSVVGFVLVMITNCVSRKIDPDSALF